jgi:23S rRNA (uracil1939-C5)-methyltransferase
MVRQVEKAKGGRKPPIQADVSLLGWASRGATWAELDGRRIAIDRGIPGERVAVSIERRRGPWRGVVEKVLEPSGLRVSAPCPYFHRGCGGCQWQHMSYDGQLALKRRLVQRELAAAAVDHPVDEVYGMDNPWRYRRTAAIAVGWEAGFRPRSRRGIVEIADCPISHPSIGRLAAALNTALRQNLLPNYHGKVWLDCTVVDGRAGPAVQVAMQGITGLTPERNPELPDVAAVIHSFGGVDSVAYRHRSGEVIPLIGPLHGTIAVSGIPLRVPAGAFFQTNVSMLEQVIGRMRDILANRRSGQAADVYGGVGTFAFALAGNLAHVALIELDAQAVDAARETAESAGIRNVGFVSARAERAIPQLGSLDLVIVDPPRSGLGDTVVNALAARQAPLLIYVSCAPSSLARDVAALEAHDYRVESLELFDFYPQTYHVESLAVLAR